MQFQYVGEFEVTFPSISKTVEPNEVFDAPDDFVAHNVISANTSIPQTTESENQEPTEKVDQ